MKIEWEKIKTLELLWKPVNTNNAYKFTRTWIMYTTKEAKDYKESVRQQASLQYKLPPYPFQVRLDIYYYWKDNRRRDHLNATKFLLDSLNKLVWEDDSQIIESHHYSYSGTKEPDRVVMDLYIKVKEEDVSG